MHYEGIDDQFLFINAGYNLRASEVNAAIGLVQYPKLTGFVNTRIRNAGLLSKSLPQWLRTQDDRGSSWFGFPVGAEDSVNVRRLREHLRGDGIETRSIICGNIARQPGMLLWPHRVSGDLGHADRVMQQGFSLPCHQAMNEADCQYIIDSIDRFV